MREEREEMSDEREGRGIHAVAPSCVLVLTSWREVTRKGV